MGNKKKFKINKSGLKDSLIRGALSSIDSMGTGLGGYGEDEKEEKNNHRLEKGYSDYKKFKKFANKKSKKVAEETAKKAGKTAGKAAAKKAAAAAGETGAAAGGAASVPVILIVLAVLLVILLLYLLFSLFEDSDYEEETKKLDTRANTAIKLVEQKVEIDALYKDLINNASSEEEKMRLTNNYNSILTSDQYIDFISTEDINSGYLLTDSNKSIFLNVERLCYAYGGYLNWKPKYLDNSINISNERSIIVNEENLEKLKPICTEIGVKYAIDPAILLAIVEVESGGDFHYNEGTESRYKGLVSMPEDFNKFYDSSEEEYFYELSQRVPVDTGSCLATDSNHTKVARFNIEYLARKLTGEMTYFLQEVKNVDFILDEIKSDDLREAILYAITAYNQGEYLQIDFYKTYSETKDVYGNNGTTYRDLFKKSMNDNGKNVGNKLAVSNYSDGYMKELENSTYLERVYKAYEKYKGVSLGNAHINFDYSEAAYKWYDNHFAYKKSYLDGESDFSDVSTAVLDHLSSDVVVLSDESIEKDLVIDIQNKAAEKEIISNIEQYNTWTKMIDDYYYSVKPAAFLKENNQRIPELYKKDNYGKDDKSSVIKYKSYIHNIVDKVSEYTTQKEYISGDIDKDYNELTTYLENGLVEGEEKVSEKISEKIAGLEKEYALEMDDIVSESLKNLMFSIDITEEENVEKVSDLLINYLAYTIPMYEYVTLDTNRARNTFFNYEIYDASSYNDKYELIIDKQNMMNMLKTINTKTVSLVDYLNGSVTKNQVKNAEKDIYRYMYLSNNKLVAPKNHNFVIPNNKDVFYLNKNGIYCDEYVENVITYEVYEDTIPEDAIVEWSASDEVYENIPYKELKAEVKREYVVSNLKPFKYTSLLDREITTFNYNKINDGDRNIKDNDYTINCEVGRVFQTNAMGTVVETGKVYRKTIIKSNTYVEKLTREEVKTERK